MSTYKPVVVVGTEATLMYKHHFQLLCTFFVYESKSKFEELFDVCIDKKQEQCCPC